MMEEWWSDQEWFLISIRSSTYMLTHICSYPDTHALNTCKLTQIHTHTHTPLKRQNAERKREREMHMPLRDSYVWEVVHPSSLHCMFVLSRALDSLLVLFKVWWQLSHSALLLPLLDCMTWSVAMSSHFLYIQYESSVCFNFFIRVENSMVLC